MTPGDKIGPLTAEDLEAIWAASVDASYRGPLLKAGDGGGMEVYRQHFAQLERVSLAVDRSFQALYILPFSGQTQPPASGAEQATVTLTFRRGGYLDRTIILGAGLVWVDEDAVDSDENGGVAVDTGRRYVITETLVFFPGEQGPFDAVAIAEKPGWGYNEPRPETISLIEQSGSEFNNELATVSVVSAPSQRSTLVAINAPDMFVPEHVGQHVLFTGGANDRKVARMTVFTAPDAAANVGSSVDLEQLVSVSTSTLSGTFVLGEAVTFSGSSSGTGVVVAQRPVDANGLGRLAVVITSGTAHVGTIFTGAVSGAAATATGLFSDGSFVAEAPSGVPETGGASWRVLDWAADLGVTATNALSPAGGVLGMLDLLGADRLLSRAANEIDDDYRERISTIADVVSPNAIRRALNRSMGSFPWCLREVGSAKLPGFFFDRAGDTSGDYYDDGSLRFTGSVTSGAFAFDEPCEYRRGLDVVVAGYWGAIVQASAQATGAYPASIDVPVAAPVVGADFTLVLARDKFMLPFPEVAWQSGDVIVGLRSGAVFTPTAVVADSRPDDKAWNTLLDYDEMRAFFAVGVPRLGFTEFGFAYDVGQHNAYDAEPFDDFYDGFPAGDVAFYSRVWSGVERSRAGGVSWVLYESDGTCA